jgi:hypothetical protein
LLFQAERLAHEAPDPVPRHRTGRETLGHDEREARVVERTGEPVEVEAGGAYHLAALQRRGDRCGTEPLLAAQALSAPQPVVEARSERQTTPSRARPLARRARITARPPRVRMRTRKPCVRLRRTTEGWNVRFIGFSLAGDGETAH